MPDRFYLPRPTPLQVGASIPLPEAEAHHILRVLRMTDGADLIIFDGHGDEYSATLEVLGKRGAAAKLLDCRQINRELPRAVHIWTAIPKGERGAAMLEQLCELGAAAVHPLLLQRAVVKPAENTIDRYQRIVIAASKQCGRNILMQVHPASNLANALTQCRPAESILLHPNPDAPELGALLRDKLTQQAPCHLWIGPEGGCTPDELTQLTAHGMPCARFGASILRIGTAAVAAMALARGLLGAVE